MIFQLANKTANATCQKYYLETNSIYLVATKVAC